MPFAEYLRRGRARAARARRRAARLAGGRRSTARSTTCSRFGARAAARRRSSRRRRSPRRRRVAVPRARRRAARTSAASTRTTGASASSCATRSRRTGRARATRRGRSATSAAAGTFLWVDPEARARARRASPTATSATGRLEAWPQLSDAVLAKPQRKVGVRPRLVKTLFDSSSANSGRTNSSNVALSQLATVDRRDRAHRRRARDVHRERDLAEVVARAGARPLCPRPACVDREHARAARRRSARRARPRSRPLPRLDGPRASCATRDRSAARRAAPRAARCARTRSPRSGSRVVRLVGTGDPLGIVVSRAPHRVLVGKTLDCLLLLFLCWFRLLVAHARILPDVGELESWEHCPRCGASVEPLEDGARIECGNCGFAYASSKPTASGLVLDDDGRVLLARRAIEPDKGKWDLPGGFLDEGEDPRDALRPRARGGDGRRGRAARVLRRRRRPLRRATTTRSARSTSTGRAACSSGEPTPADDVAELRWFAPGRAAVRRRSSPSEQRDGPLTLAGRARVARAARSRTRAASRAAPARRRSPRAATRAARRP